MFIFILRPLETTRNGKRKRNGQPYCKKPCLQVHKWKKNVAKAKRNVGDAYVSFGVERRAKRIQEPCGQQCLRQCSNKFTQEQRENLFRYYWNLENITRKREFVVTCLEQVHAKYPQKKDGSTRSLNYAYHFILNNERIRVCSKFFCNTLDISYRMIRTSVSKFFKNTNNSLVEGELRGKYDRKRIKDESQD